MLAASKYFPKTITLSARRTVLFRVNKHNVHRQVADFFVPDRECDSEREPHAKAFMSASGSPKSRKKILNGVRASVILSDNYWKLDGSEVNGLQNLQNSSVELQAQDVACGYMRTMSSTPSTSTLKKSTADPSRPASFSLRPVE